MSWGTKVERERHRRIRIALAAYSYEFCSHSIMSDGNFDKMSREIDPNIKTGNKVLDTFFATRFEPDTGMWIHQHPHLDKIEALYERLYK